MSQMNKILGDFLVLLAGLAASVSAQNPAGWGACQATPAVVNPAVLSPFQSVLSLRGEWDFVKDGDFLFHCSFDEAQKIQVPGCWEAQGVGDPDMSKTWDIYWDCNPRPLSHVFMGCGTYKKQVEIPADWAGKEIWLKVGGVRSEAYFWVNGEQIGIINNFCGSYKYNITEFVTPGKTAEIVGMVKNDVPSRKGQMCDFHKFGGFYRDIELEATPKTWIDDVWVEGKLSNGDNDVPTAFVHITPGSVEDGTETSAVVRIKTLDGQEVAAGEIDLTVKAEENELGDVFAEDVCEIEVENAELWTPEKPALYLAEVEITAEDGVKHGWVERFGFREFKAEGTRFYLNGRPYFIRGFGETFIYPITLVSPADREAHLKNMAVIKKTGFNQTRMHTHCELPEFFEAADEMGILIQPELPYNGEHPCEGFTSNALGDMKELYRHYRRYTSLGFYCCGNEGFFGERKAKEIYDWLKKTDPSRPAEHQDGGTNQPGFADYGTMPYNVWPRGTYDEVEFPFIAHEYLNLTVKLDPRLEPLFTGAIPSPVSMEKYEARLQELGLSREWGDACIKAAHSLQAFYQKRGLESARRDPACDGYNFWNFVDQMVVQGPAYTSQGYMNAFYQVKDGGMPPEEFALFNSPSAILAEFEQTDPQSEDGCNVYTSEETFKVDFWISHFEEKPIENGRILWQIENQNGEIVTSGTESIDDLETGDVVLAKSVEISLPEVNTPAQWTLRASIDGTDVKNHWPVWVFPEREKPSLAGIMVDPEWFDWFDERYTDVVAYGDDEMKPADALITRLDSDNYKQAVEEGRKILAIRPTEGIANISLGWWWMGSQLGTAFAQDPVYGDFPHNGTMNPLWFRIINTDPINLSEVAGIYEPLALGELIDDYSLYLGRAKIGNSEVLAAYGLDLFRDFPETLALFDNLIRSLK